MGKNSKKALRRPYIRQFYHRNVLSFAFAVVSVLLIASINLALSSLMKELVDTISRVEGSRPLSTLAFMTAGLIVFVILACAISYFSKPRFMRNAILQYKNYAFEKLTRKSISSFRGEAAAAYISALSNDTNSIEANYLEQQFSLIGSVTLFAGSFALMLYYSPMLTAASVLLSILPMAASVLAGNKLKVAERQVSDNNASFTAVLKDSLSGFSVVKSFRAEKAIFELFSNSNLELENAKCKRRKLAAIIGAIGSVTGATAQLGVFLVGAYLALYRGSITAGTVIVFLNLMNFVIQPIAEVPGILANRRAAIELIDKLAEALETNIREEGEDIATELSQGIELRALSFGYTPENEILHNINFRFEAGKSYAVVGASGSGKSTLLNLLMASREDYSGGVFYDGQELRSVSTKSLYDLVSHVEQNVFVFNASIRDNITMFRDFDDVEIRRAIRLSGLSELISRRGEDYLCGENGSALSGGEKQRISIARSLLRKSSVLLADEATAALDAETSFQVSDAILKLDGLTRIIVTHSLEESLLRQYDGILALKSGSIIESGSFDELMEQRGYFYSLYTISQ